MIQYYPGELVRITSKKSFFYGCSGKVLKSDQSGFLVQFKKAGGFSDKKIERELYFDWSELGPYKESEK